jgi:lipid-A-disaccharide synthase
MISCGEPSGDLYAAALVTELRAQEPAATVFGFGGERMEAAGARLVGHFAGLSVAGLTEIVRILPQAYGMYRRLVAAARARRPDVFVAIDFAGFNFYLLAAMWRLGVPVVYYVSPQLWAWRPRRMKTMKRFVSKVLVIFPFESAFYERAGVPVRFVGHPLVDLARASRSRGDFLRGHSLSPEVPTVALLPGSRQSEVARIAPVLISALPLIRARVPGVQFVVARAPGLADRWFSALSASGATVVDGHADDVLTASDVVITASGTATVQAALHERPMVVVYRVSALSYRLGKPFLNVDTYAMPNLIAGRAIVPELIQEACTAERVAAEAIGLLTDLTRYDAMRTALRDVRDRLGSSGASGRAAAAVLEVAAGHARQTRH